jgi:preprotein translocase subunit SecA
MALLGKLFGDANAKLIQSFKPTVERVRSLGPDADARSAGKIRERALAIRAAIGGDAAKLEAYLPEVFALTRAAAAGTIGLRHFDVQVLGGIALFRGMIAEMKTGEGKTLVATLPVALEAMTGHGVHVVTVNDYLARRDAGWMGPVYHALGLSIGVIVHDAALVYDPGEFSESPDPRLRHLKPVSRREAYAADITYGTNNEFGFDYLRDNMVPAAGLEVQRALNYAIVDEVDSILVDEARTPLIISAAAEESTEQHVRFAAVVTKLEPERHFTVDEKLRAVTLTEEGIARVEKILGVPNLYVAGGLEQVHHLEAALKARVLYLKDRDYVVKDGEVIIVDEFTGRLMFGRRYSEGLHQAIEAKEGVPIQQESQTLATVTFQNYFRLYRKLAGMTGTAATEAEEFHKIYNLDVAVIPTHKPMVRQDASDAVYKNETGKFTAVIREVKRRHALGQPVLIGTISIEKNERLSELLQREGVAHEILNAKNHEREAEIIAQAGRNGAVTLATNIAGRGVDIILGGNPPNATEQAEVVRLGGLHILGTERHEARRIDNQLRGRSGRQGDPGSSQFFVSLEDDLMRIFGGERIRGLMERLGVPDDVPIENRMVSRSIESAQKKVEGHNFDIRKHLVEYDDIMNKHREVLYARRRAALKATVTELEGLVSDMVGKELERIVHAHTSEPQASAWGVEKIYEVVGTLFAVGVPERLRLDDIQGEARADAAADSAARAKLLEYLERLGAKALNKVAQSFARPEDFAVVLRSIVLRTIDQLWIEHLDRMDHLREGIGLRGYGQRDPLVEYKREAYRLFTELLGGIEASVAVAVYRIAPTLAVAASPMQRANVSAEHRAIPSLDATPVEPPRATAVTTAPRGSRSFTGVPSNLKDVGRNDPCPCGSGRKFKKCFLAQHPDCKLIQSGSRPA